MQKHFDEQITHYGQQVIVNLVSECIPCEYTCLSKCRHKHTCMNIFDSVVHVCITVHASVIIISMQIDQKGSERKLGEAFQHYVQSLASCLIGLVQ